MGVVAEHLFGAARGIDDVVYLNGGASGIGGGLVVHGIPVAGANGYAGEFGHNRPGIPSESDRRARDGVLEDEVSRARLLSAVGLHNADEPTLAAALTDAESPDVVAEVARQRRILSTALANAVNVLNPSVVVLGGFLASLASRDLTGLRDAVADQAMPGTAEDLDIRVAVLAEDRLLIGAAEAVFSDVMHDPLAVAS
jgi:predicted NBD/HSP70 family sugar kinase